MTSQIIDQYVHSINLVKFKNIYIDQWPPLEFAKGGPMPPLGFSKGGPMPPLEFFKGGQNFLKGGQCPPLGGAVYHPGSCP